MISTGEIDITSGNPIGCIYLKGNKTTEGSFRFCIDPDNGNAIIEKLIDGTWESIAELVGVESNISIFFDNFNARFFGELGLPDLQTWTIFVTGSATVDLIPDIVFGEAKDVVKINDNVADGLVIIAKALTANDWLDIEEFGASYGGVSRLDTDDGINGFFSGLQANSAENPLGTGNRRYGLYFQSDGGYLQADVLGGLTITFDGLSGRDLILFDEWFKWEIVIPINLGLGVLFVNGKETTAVPFYVNSGGLGTQVLVSSGSTGGIDRISYHDNFGVTIYKESPNKILSIENMATDKITIITPRGQRDYIIILPDDNPRGIGDGLDILANNIGGSVTLRSEDLNASQVLFNGFHLISIDITQNKEVQFTNTVESGNVYQAPTALSRDFSRLISYLPIASPYTTPSLSAGVPTKLLIPTTPKSIKDFTLDIPNLRWFLNDPTGLNRWFMVHMTTSITTSSSNHTVTLEMYKNGILESGMSIQRFISGGSDQSALTIIGSVQLNDTDYIEIYVTDSSNGTVTFSRVSIIINEMVGAVN